MYSDFASTYSHHLRTGTIVLLLIELARLLSTATDEDRKEVIRKAMSALDSHERVIDKPDKFNVQVNPTIQASLIHGNSVSTLIINRYLLCAILPTSLDIDANDDGKHEFSAIAADECSQAALYA
jgi:hypothetical protein